MKVLKIVLIAIAIIFVVPLVIALFVPKEYAVERIITINKPNAVVFDYIKYVKNQDNFSIWNTKDPQMKKDYKGTDGTVGFIYYWDSNHKEVGKGEQEITKIVDGSRVEMKLRFKIPFEAEDDAYISTEAISENQTKVKWGFSGAFPYPFNLMKLFMNMDAEIGKDLGTGLSNLKKVMEK